MNETIKSIMTRRSIRDFTDKKVDKSDMELLIKCALTAPSAVNKQTWKMTGVLNGDIIKELIAAIKKVTGNEKYNMYAPTALIIPSNEKDSKWGRDDNACALENIFLAAHSMGIGSVWINQLVGNSDVPEIRAILTKLNIPENHIVYGIAALGYSASEPVGEKEKIGTFEIVE